MVNEGLRKVPTSYHAAHYQMKATILKKISKELKNGINTEPEVLYLLAQIRKDIDEYKHKDKNRFPNLYFYCNWILHTTMSKTPAKTILNRFESLFQNTGDLKEMSNIFRNKEKNFYLFIDLKQELLKFLLENNLPTELLKNGHKWFTFKKLLVALLMDCPLVNKGTRVWEFAYEEGADDQIRFRIRIENLGSFKTTLKEKRPRSSK